MHGGSIILEQQWWNILLLLVKSILKTVAHYPRQENKTFKQFTTALDLTLLL